MTDTSLPTRDKLLTSGLKLFSSKGYLATTTREVARKAGVAEITLFRHFPTKEKLLEEVIASFSVIPALTEIQPELRKRSCEDALTLMAEFLLESMVKRKEWIVLMQSEVRRNPEKLLLVYHSFMDRLYTIIADYFRDQQQAGCMRCFDPELAARAFYGLIYSFFNAEEVLLRKEYRATDRKSAIHGFISIFSNGLAMS